MRKESFFWSTDHWQLTTDQSFVYDEWNVIMVLDGLDNNAITRKYSWGLDLSGRFHAAGGIGGLLAVEETSGTHQGSYWYFYDANGNVGQLVKGSDSSLPIAAQYEYDAYGNPAVNPSGTYAAANPFRFSTKWLDAETGLYYYGYRYYSSKTGRWLSRDIIVEAGGVLLYGTLKNGPTLRYDHLGLCYEEEIKVEVCGLEVKRTNVQSLGGISYPSRFCSSGWAWWFGTSYTEELIWKYCKIKHYKKKDTCDCQDAPDKPSENIGLDREESWGAKYIEKWETICLDDPVV